MLHNNLKDDPLKAKWTVISSGKTAHHKPTLIIQDQSLYSRQNKWQSHRAIDRSAYRKPPKDHKLTLAMPDQPWAQTPHTLPGRIREGMCKARKTEDGKVIEWSQGWCCAKLTMDGCRSKQSQGAGSEQGIGLIIRRCVIVSNSLGQIPDPRLISSISPMIGQASRPQCASEEMPQVKSTTHHIIKHKHMSIKENASNGIIRWVHHVKERQQRQYSRIEL